MNAHDFSEFLDSPELQASDRLPVSAGLWLPLLSGALALLLMACDSARPLPPPVQESSQSAATDLVHTSAGKPFTSSCLIVDLGATVEWRNLSPRSQISMVSTAAPYELSSPSLTLPYNGVAPEQSDECARRDGDTCAERAPFSFWRHTFKSPGVFDYRDSSGGGAAAVTTGTYGYGMPSGPTTPTASVATGTVCVRAADGSGCSKVCCIATRTDDCATGVSCISGRCGGVSL